MSEKNPTDMQTAYTAFKWDQFKAFTKTMGLKIEEADMDGEENTFFEPSQEWIAAWSAAKLKHPPSKQAKLAQQCRAEFKNRSEL